jgi:hypothetical protein
MRCDAMRCDAMRCDAMRCDAMRCDAMRCDAMLCHALQKATKDAHADRRNAAGGVAERLYLEKRIEAEISRERTYKHQARAIWSALRRGDTEAFHFPSRMIGTFVVSVFSVSFVAANIHNMFLGIRASVQQADVAMIKTSYYSLVVLQQQFELLTGADLPKEGSRWLEDNVQRMHGYLVDLGDSLVICHAIGATFGVLLYTAAWVVLCLDFRAQVIQARRGIWQFNVAKVKLFHSMTYVATQVSNGLITYILFTVIFSFVFLVLVWSASRDALRLTFLYFWPSPLLQIMLCVLIPVLMKLTLKKFFGPNQVIKMRYFYMAFDLFEVLIRIAAGVVTAIVRFLLVMLGVALSLPRLDRSPFPAWMEAYLLLDSGSRSYQGLILLHSAHNNPVMRVAAWMISEDAKARREPGRAAAGFVSHKRRRVANRFQLAWMLYKNPTLRSYRGVGLSAKKINQIKRAGATGKEMPSLDELDQNASKNASSRPAATTVSSTRSGRAPSSQTRYIASSNEPTDVASMKVAKVGSIKSAASLTE